MPSYKNTAMYTNKNNDNNLVFLIGRVYNITPYLEYHPGGIPEIMRGVGKDGTDLFDEVNRFYFSYW